MYYTLDSFSTCEQTLPESVKRFFPLFRSTAASKDRLVLDRTSRKVRHYLGMRVRWMEPRQVA